MAKRSYHRRTDEEIILSLESRIKKIERREESKVRVDAPVLKDIPRIKRILARFSQHCMDHGRSDLSNSVLAFLAMLENQAKELPSGHKNTVTES